MPASEAVLAKLRERILAFAASRIGRPEAEDLAQETLMLLHQKYGEVDAIEELVPLAFRILRFKMAAGFRKSARRGEDSAIPVEDANLRSTDDPEDGLLARERRRLMLDALDALGERCREILKMKMSGLGFDEIRVHLGAASINTVYVWDLRCRRELIERLRMIWETPK
jgi:RNA polymerase sigma-70 factor (ECF subfamily)